MNEVKKKLKSLAGETIGETLVALLIAALALVMLAGAVTAANRVVTRSKDTLNTYYAENNKLDGLPQAVTGSESATVVLQDSENTSNVLSVSVVEYTNDTFAAKPVSAYAIPTPVP